MVIISENVELLLILIGFCIFCNIYFLKLERGNIPWKFYAPVCTVDRTIVKNILFLHGISGFDTSSTLYKQYKMKLLKHFTINAYLQKVVAVLKNPDADTEAVINARLLFIVSLYT